MSNERYIGNGLIAWRDVESQASREQLIDILDKYAEKFTIEIDVIGGWVEIGCGKTPREAIDNAMKGGE